MCECGGGLFCNGRNYIILDVERWGLGVSCHAAVLLWTHAEESRTSYEQRSSCSRETAVAFTLHQMLIAMWGFTAFAQVWVEAGRGLEKLQDNILAADAFHETMRGLLADETL